MLFLHDKNETDFRWNGKPLPEATKAIVKGVANGEFVLDVIYPITKTEVYRSLAEDKIITTNLPVRGVQGFRIKKIHRTLKTVQLRCEHLYMDMMEHSVAPFSVSGNGMTALTQLMGAIKTPDNRFTWSSDIMHHYNFSTDKDTTVYDVLMNGDNSLLSVWKGELEVDNFRISMKNSIGRDRNLVISSRSNLRDLLWEISTENVVTRLHITSKFREEKAEEDTVLKVTVDSPYINSYPYVKELELENNDIKTVDELRTWGVEKFKNDKLDLPTSKITVDATLIKGQVAHLGDTVSVRNLTHGIEMEKKVTEYEYDAIGERYISITFDDKVSYGGSGRSLASNVTNAIDFKTSQSNTEINKLIDNANRVFDEKFEETKREIEDGVQQALAQSEVFKQNITDQVNEALQGIELPSLDKKLEDVKAEMTGDIEKAKQEVTDSNVKLTGKVNDVNKRIDNLRVGARNYLTGTADMVIDNSVPIEETRSRRVFHVDGNAETIDVENGTKKGVRLSPGASIYQGNYDLGIGSFIFHFKVSGGENAIFSVQGSESSSSSDHRTPVSGKIYTSIKRFSQSVRNSEKLAIVTNNSSADLLIHDLKIEYGDIPTSWSLAPEDIDGKFFEQEQTINGIKTRVESSERENGVLKQNLATYQQTATGMETKIRNVETSADSVKQDLASYKQTADRKAEELTRLIGQADGKAVEAKAYAEQTANGFKTRIETVEQYANGETERANRYLQASKTETAKMLQTERTEISKNYIAKSKHEEDVRGINQRFEEITIGARNYVLNSDVCTTDEQMNFNLAFEDIQVLRNKKITLSVDVETVNASGSRGGHTRNGFEFYVRYTDNTTLWAQCFNNASNFKGRIHKTYQVADKPIREISSYIQNKFATGTSKTCRPQLEIASLPSNYLPAEEDLRTSFATYKQGIDGQFANINRTVQTATGDINKLKTDISNVAGQITQAVTSATSGMVKHSEINMTPERITFGAGKTIDTQYIASMFNVDDKMISAVSDKFVIAGSHYNLASKDKQVTWRPTGARQSSATPYMTDTLKSGDELYISADVTRLTTGATKVHGFYIGVTYEDGTNDWWHTQGDNDKTGRIEKTIRIPALTKKVKSYNVQFFQDGRSGFSTYKLDNLVIRRKSDANLIVDGTIQGKHLATGTIESGHIKADAITGDKIMMDKAFFDKLVSEQIITQNLTAKQLFATSVQAVDLSASKITSGTLSADRIFGGSLSAKNGAVKFDLDNSRLTFNNNAEIIFNSGDNVVKRVLNGVTGFLQFADDKYNGVYAGLGVTSGYHGVNSESSGKFAGIRIFRPNDGLDKIEFYGDSVQFSHSFSEGGSLIWNHSDYKGQTWNLFSILRTFNDNFKQIVAHPDGGAYIQTFNSL